MERGSSMHSLKTKEMGKSTKKRTRSSALMLMSWEKRYQHTMKDFLRVSHNKQNFIQDHPLGYSAPAAQNLRLAFEDKSENPQESQSVSDNDRYYSSGQRKKRTSPQTNDEFSAGKVASPRQNKARVDFVQDISSSSLLCQNTSASDKPELPHLKSLSLIQDESSSLILTNKLTPHHEVQPLREEINSLERVGNIDLNPSKAYVSDNRKSCSQNHCHEEVGFNLSNTKGAENPHGKQYNVYLNKTLKYAAKYNLDQIFTCAFPQVKKPLKQRLKCI